MSCGLGTLAHTTDTFFLLARTQVDNLSKQLGLGEFKSVSFLSSLFSYLTLHPLFSLSSPPLSSLSAFISPIDLSTSICEFDFSLRSTSPSPDKLNERKPDPIDKTKVQRKSGRQEKAAPLFFSPSLPSLPPSAVVQSRTIQ